MAVTGDEVGAGDRYRAAFEAASAAMLIADDDRRYLDANDAACKLLGLPREGVLELRVDDVTPPWVDVEPAWREFLRHGRQRGEYTVRRPDGSTVEVEFQATANVLPGQHLSIMQDVGARKEAERALAESRRRLEEAHDHVHTIAVTLQQAMLPATAAVPGVEFAARYAPAIDALKVGGDWYELIELGQHCVGVAVGDVMGHGVVAAGIMGQLRSALAAVMRADGSPASALGVLDGYARSLAQPHTATVLAAIIDLDKRTLTYSSAGHLPGLVMGDGVRFLDEATAPPLLATLEVEERPQATVSLPPGATVVLFTDGLIERRREDIDDGLARIAALASSLQGRDCEAVADALLDACTSGSASNDDDIALIVLRT